MLVNLYRGKLDIKKRMPFKPIFVQYDSAKLEIELLDNGKILDISDATRVELTHLLKDGKVIIGNGVIESALSALVTYQYQGSEMEFIGKVQTTLTLLDDADKKVSTFSFEVTVEKDIQSEVFSEANPDYGLVHKLKRDVEELLANGMGNGGSPGKDGEDGYTPIKGVDYFDGINGKDGTDGTDGTNATVILNDTVTSTSTTEVATANAVRKAYDRAEEAFTLASNNKALLSQAITGKGGNANPNNTFSELADAITNIPIPVVDDNRKQMRKDTFKNTSILTVSGLPFVPSAVIVRAYLPSSESFTLATHISGEVDSGVTQLFNEYSFLASISEVQFIPSGISVNGYGFRFEIGSGEFDGVWIAFE